MCKGERDLEYTDKFEIKVFILFLLKNVNEPLPFSTINDIVIQDGFVTYYDFAICFAELLEAKQINEIKGNEIKYVISDDGRLAIESYEDSIYASVREKALRSAMRLLASNRDGSRIISRIEPNGEGYDFIGEISNKTRTLYYTKVYVAELDYAKRLKENFEERAEIIYKGSLSLLSGDINFIFEE